MRTKLVPVFCITFLTICLGSGAYAQTVLLPLLDDAFINANAPNRNYGELNYIFIHSYGPKQGLVKFNAGHVAGEIFESATLTLFLNEIRNAGWINVYAITSSWNEYSVTWNNQPPVEATPVATVGLTTLDEGSDISIDVTSAVKRWAAGTLPAAGFLITTSDGIRAIFDSYDKRPRLTFSYEQSVASMFYEGSIVISSSVAPGLSTSMTSYCEPGDFAISGDVSSGPGIVGPAGEPTITVLSSSRSGNESWWFNVKNIGNTEAFIEVKAICAKVTLVK